MSTIRQMGNKMQCDHTAEYHSAVLRKEVLIWAAMEMNLESMTLGDRSQTNTGGSYHGQRGGWGQEGLTADCLQARGFQWGDENILVLVVQHWMYSMPLTLPSSG